MKSEFLTVCAATCASVLAVLAVGGCRTSAPSSVANETLRLQRAIDAAAAAGGTVVLEPGIHEVTTLELKSNVTLEIPAGAVLKGHPNLETYRDIPLEWSEMKTPWKALVYAECATNVAIVGGGVIDGSGGEMTGKMRHGQDRPRGILLNRCSDVRIENVTICETMSWCCYLKECVGVVVRGLRVDSHARGNSDGIDIEASDVLVEDCDFDCDDDAVCLKSDNPHFAVTNVVVRNCRLATTCAAFKIGTASAGRVEGVRASGLRCERPRRVHRKANGTACYDRRRADARRGGRFFPGVTEEVTGICAVNVECVDGGIVRDVRISDVVAEGYLTGFFIRLGARRENLRDSASPTALENVVVENMKSRAASRIANSITGVPGRRVKDVTVRNCLFVSPGGGTVSEAETVPPEAEGRYPECYMFDMQALPAHGAYVRHADGVRFENVSFVAETVDARPAVVKADVR